VPTDATLADVRALYERGSGVAEHAYTERIERYRSTGRDVVFSSTAVVRDGDFRLTSMLGAAAYESGRRSGRRWRRTPSGVVRIIESDVQGDDLDRWPVAILGFEFERSVVAGETPGPNKAYVLDYAPDGELPHWLYVDASTGLVRREVSRDGSRVATYDFDDFRLTDGVRRPFRWRVGGAGAPLDVVVDDVSERVVAENEVALPPSTTNGFALGSDAIVRLPASFQRDRIDVDVSIDGRPAKFVLDTGTTQVLIDGGVAHRFGLTETLDHVIAPSMAVGRLTATAVPVLTVGLGPGWGFDGILGNEFFLGHIVHVNYRDRYVDVVPHDLFEPPAGASIIPVSCAEGMPIAAGAIDGIAGTRFALDTGSLDIVVPWYFTEHDARGATLHARDVGGNGRSSYLEGPTVTRRALVPNVTVGPFKIPDPVIDIEMTNRGTTLDIPLDAIVGTSVLSQLDLWFDYDNGRVYAKPF